VRDHRHLIADLLDLAEQVGVEEDRTVAIARGPHEGPGVVLADGVGRGGLVEDSQLLVAADGDG
jgi:2-polyprenyl-6-methoxyphenol hydroxylase-like FAD-dependent oxidoreductase